ncbi:MAG: hypothetical protein KDA32_05975 [Phycisphaerales bacterium]|nr:hypothetical protein [Phycisphaerales bacterium]
MLRSLHTSCAIALLLALSGCKPNPERKHAPIAPAQEVIAEPVSLAKEALRLLKAERAALKAGDKAAAHSALMRERGLANDADYRKALPTASLTPDEIEQLVMSLFVERWGATVAAYLDDCRVDEAALGGADGEHVIVRAPTSGDVAILVICAKQADNTWRVHSLLLDARPAKTGADD